MDDKKALEIVKEAAEEIATTWAEPEATGDLRAALAHLQGKHAYFSRFKPGDKVFLLSGGKVYEGEIGNVRFDKVDRIIECVGYREDHTKWWGPYLEKICFPTREEAQAECDKRNKEGE